MFHFLQKKMLKKIRNKGTINVLQGGGGVSGVWSKTILLHFFFFGPFPKSLLKFIYILMDTFFWCLDNSSMSPTKIC